MENFKDKIIKNKKLGIVCHDAGGSEIVSSWLKRKKNQFYLSVSGPALNIFKRKIGNFKNYNLNNLILKSDIIITGTSLKSKKEFNAIKKAKKENKLSISFLDHWVNYKKRFERNRSYIAPNFVVVTDKYAKIIAKKELNKEFSILFTKNYYLIDLKNKIKNYKSKIKRNKFYAVYFSSNLDAANFKFSDNFFLKKGIDYFRKNKSFEDIKILIRRHPSENKKKFSNLKIKGAKIFFDKNKSLINTISENKIFFGFESMALVVASFCRKKTFSFRTKIKKHNVIPKKYINSYIVI